MKQEQSGAILTFIKTISLFNSGNYAFFEEDFNQNVILEGNNNIGKTTILNSIQLSLLPETNLKNFKNKFSISSSQNKSFSSKETYDFYFPSENSYIILEIENPEANFCLILHRTKINNNNYEYGRLLVELPFEEVRKFLVKKNNLGENILINTERSVFFDQLKNELPKDALFKEIRDIKDVTSYLLSTRLDGKENKYCVVPLKDTKKDTLQGFSTLLKSLYNASNMNQEARKEFVANIIEARKVSNEEKKYIDFDLKDTIEKNNELIARKEYFSIMDNHKDNYDKLINIFEEFKMENQDLQYTIRNIYNSALKEIEELEVVRDKFNDENSINERNLNELKETIRKNNSDIVSLNENIAINNSQISSFMSNYRKSVSTLFSIDEFNEQNNNNNNLSEENTLRAILSIDENNTSDFDNFKLFIPMLEEYISNHQSVIEITKTQIENLKNINNLKSENDSNIEDIQDLRFKIHMFEKQLNELPMHLSEEFSEEEQKILKTLFKDDFLFNDVKKISSDKLESIKSFLGIFKSRGNSVSLDEISIDTSIFSNNTNDILQKKEALEKELVLKESELNVINMNEDEDIALKISQSEDKLKILEKEISDYENCIYTIKNILPNNSQISHFEKENEELFQKLNFIEENKQETSFNIINLEGEMSEQKKIFNNSFTMLRKMSEYVEEIEDFHSVEEYFFMDVEDIELPEEEVLKVSDPISEFLTYKKRLEAYKNNRIDIISIISKFVSNHIFDNDIQSSILDSYSELSESGQTSLFKLITDLINKFSKLQEEKELLRSEIESLNNEIISTNGELLEMVNEIKKFRKEINSELENIQISNLPGVSFDIEIDKKLLKLLEDLETFNLNDKEVSDNHIYFEKLSNYIFEKTKQNNIIKIVDLIENVDYSIFSIIEETGKRVKTKNSQSNGTETMINLLFISILFDSIFKENRKLQLIIPLDEVSNVDYNNILTLINTMKERDCKIVAASPIASPDQLSVFDRAVVIDKEVVKNKISDRGQYIVVKDDSVINIFKNVEAE